ncbi:MAG: protein kinase [Gammaproteobacteria bacterium]|nr:serine/threonine protein kinase [Gammaproteobacteria bacterium]NIW57106.1 protein kinase [Gammaproteobacteria bacterium]
MMPNHELALPPGTKIDSFEIRSVLGTGGFGITYGAYDNRLERRVAIKEYFPSGLAFRSSGSTTLQLTSQTDGDAYEYGLKRFLDEGRVLAKFREPSIVRVTQFLEANGTAYLVMDYEDGEPLSAHLDRVVTLDETEVKEIVIPILEGLSVVHAKQYLHRDIKPSNIFLRKSGPPVLLDFGAARRALEEQSSAMTVMLTPGYAPFEQYSKGDKQGPWSDIYALGATIYHCIVGAAPTPATDRLTSIYDNEPDPVVQALKIIAPRCSPVFVKTIEWMLKPHAKDRPQDARAVLNVLCPIREMEENTTSRNGQNTSVAREARTIMATDADVDILLPEGADETVFMPRSAGSPFVCSPEMVVALETVLEEFVGGLARRVVAPAVPKAANFDDLTHFLAGFILTDGSQARFMDRVKALREAERNGSLASAAAGDEPSAGAVSGDPAHLDLEPQELQRVQQRLANHIGPIARIIVKKAQAECGTRDEFYERLAEELTDPAERDEFLSSLD